MSKRILLVVVGVVAVVLASGFVGVTNSEGFRGGGFWHHRGNIPINWRVAGTITYVELYSPYVEPLSDSTFPTVQGTIIDIVTKGKPFGARSKVIGIANGVVPDTEGDCVEDFKLLFEYDDMIVTFPDLSMLFATGKDDPPGFHCFLDPFPQLAVAHMKIIGGTGKYAGASGEYTGTFRGGPVGESGTLGYETGTIVGEIVR